VIFPTFQINLGDASRRDSVVVNGGGWPSSAGWSCPRRRSGRLLSALNGRWDTSSAIPRALRPLRHQHVLSGGGIWSNMDSGYLPPRPFRIRRPGRSPKRRGDPHQPGPVEQGSSLARQARSLRAGPQRQHHPSRHRDRGRSSTFAGRDEYYLIENRENRPERRQHVYWTAIRRRT